MAEVELLEFVELKTRNYCSAPAWAMNVPLPRIAAVKLSRSASMEIQIKHLKEKLKNKKKKLFRK